jgi:osmotically-inducible protein OsmY
MAQDRSSRYGDDYPDYEGETYRGREGAGFGYGRYAPDRWRGWWRGDYARGPRDQGNWRDYDERNGRNGWSGGGMGRYQGAAYEGWPYRGGGYYGTGGYGYEGYDEVPRYGSGRAYGGPDRGYAQGGRDFWDRASDEVSSWFGDEEAAARRRRDQHRGRGPKSYVRSDERIEEDINDRLTDDWSLDATDIEVEVSDRDVTLSGEVSSRADKRRAEDIAESVSGVGNVQNNIRVRQHSAGSEGMSAP